MKTIVKLIVLFSFLFCLKGHAQDPGPMASNSSFKGKRELRKEKRILRSERSHTRSNEHKIGRSTRKFAGTRFGTHKPKKKKAAPAPAVEPASPDTDKPKG